LLNLATFRREDRVLDPMLVARVELCALGSWVIGANMQGKLFVALQLEVAHHFVERCAGERSRRFEPPPTFGATKTSKTLLLNPHQLPSHGCLCRCAPTPSDRMPSTSLPSVDEAFSFRIGVLPDCSRKPSPSLGVAEMRRGRGTGAVYVRQFGRSVGHPTYIEDFCLSARRFGL